MRKIADRGNVIRYVLMSFVQIIYGSCCALFFSA